jgi:hypothetical protein
VHGVASACYDQIPAGFYRHQFRHEFLMTALVSLAVTVLLSHLWLRWQKFQLDLAPRAVTVAFGAMLLAVLVAPVAPFRFAISAPMSRKIVVIARAAR